MSRMLYILVGFLLLNPIFQPLIGQSFSYSDQSSNFSAGQHLLVLPEGQVAVVGMRNMLENEALHLYQT